LGSRGSQQRQPRKLSTPEPSTRPSAGASMGAGMPRRASDTRSESKHGMEKEDPRPTLLLPGLLQARNPRWVSFLPKKATRSGSRRWFQPAGPDSRLPTRPAPSSCRPPRNRSAM
jgi:hypothetical protein